jgi:hypothetical protein
MNTIFGLFDRHKAGNKAFTNRIGATKFTASRILNVQMFKMKITIALVKISTIFYE